MKNFFEDVSLSFYPFSSADVITASEIETPPDFLEPFSPDGTNVTKSALPRAARQRTGLLLLFAFLLFSALFSLGFSALPASAAETDYFSTVSVELSENISVRYTLAVPTGAEKLSVRFSFNGKEEIKTADVSGKSEQVVCFDGITPQYLGRELKTTVSFDGGAPQEDTFSVKSYCETLLAACPADYTAEEYAALRRLVCNLLLYGEAAQRYVGSPDPSCAAGLTEQERADAFDLLPTSSCVSVTGEEEGLRFYSASLLLGSSVRIKIVFLCTRELTAPSLRLGGADGETDTEISGGEVWTQADGNEWYAYTAVSSPISLLRFSTPFEATVYEGEESLDKTLTYGVFSYVFSKAGERDEGGTPTPTANLAAALYNYGYAAEVFRTTREIVSAVQKEVSAASGGTFKLPQSLPLAGEIVRSAEENGLIDAASGR